MVPNWKQKYILEISDLESPVNGDESSLLYLCFVQKKISCSDFLEWAQSETQLPIVKSDYFNNSIWDSNLLKLRPDLKKFWNHILVPIGEWDGHLIVGGAYLPEDFPKDQVIFVLSHYNSTEKIWDQIAAAKAPTHKPLEEIQLLDAEPESEFVIEDESEDKKNLPVVSEEDDAGDLQLNPELPTDMLQKLDFSQVVQPKVLQAPVDDENSGLIKTNTGIKIDSVTGTKSKITMNGTNTSIPLNKSEHTSTRSKINITTVSGQTKTNTKIPSPATARSAVPLAPPLAPKPTPATVAAKAPAPASAPTASQKSSKPFSAMDLDYSEVFNMWNEVQEEMQTYYDKCYLITVNPSHILIPQIWSDNVVVSAQKVEISVDSPSMFNIVAKTLKSYHGHVVPNEVNDRFFAKWNESSVPDHVTLSPLVLNNQLCGYLMGIGPKSAYNKNSLKLVEKLAEQIKTALEKSLKQLAG